jgi:non-specific serine/threonine protein kinase/serine/threonine-protein kinase
MNPTMGQVDGAPYEWKEVKSIFAALLKLSPDRRSVFLDSACANRPELRAEVESLLSAHDEATGFLTQAASPIRANDIAGAALDSLAPGERVGVYTIVQKLDEGGMAAVYQAIRDDDEFRKLVAIKILKAGMDTRFILDRFQKEKQILAHFDHPNIAKLLDSGSTAQGRPYFVLEFIAGQPIDIFCKENRLSIEDRLRLMQRVCAAVEYAHQNLIVHRDLKPRNILVTTDGTPKLLDFGIAKILSDERERTITGLQLMTPEYASPEQIRGEAVSTVTDVYCLGVILYELLTGRRPFRAPTGSPHELARIILDSEAKRPSTLVRGLDQSEEAPCARPQIVKWATRLRGDLDNIVLKAMHADPQRRYRSVGELSADIDRYFRGLPVYAAGDGFRYRARKFVTRHRTSVAVALLFVVSLAIGLVLLQREAAIARNQREVSEKNAAEIRRLANSLIFDLHDAIQSLPGATPVRAQLMDSAAHALDGLSKNAPEDPQIQRELAAAYQRLGQVQGAPLTSNLGDLSGALSIYNKAVAILEKIHAKSPADLEISRLLASSYWDISSIYSRRGDKETAAQNGRKAIELRESAARAAAGTLDSKRESAVAFYMRANLAVDAGDLESARTARRQSYEIWESVAAADPNDSSAQFQVALAAKNLSAVEQRFQDFGSASRLLQRARQIDHQRSQASPQDARAHLDLSFDLSELAELSIRTGDVDEAAEFYTEARAIREALLARDPGNSRLKDRTAFISSRYGRVLLRLGRTQEARTSFERAFALRRELAADQSNAHAQFSLIESQGDLGAWRCAAGYARQGRAELSSALSAIDSMIARNAVSVEEKESAAELRLQLARCGSKTVQTMRALE